jgi:hypothetical protein
MPLNRHSFDDGTSEIIATKTTKMTRITRNEIVSFVVFVVEIFVPFVIQTADKWQG